LSADVTSSQQGGLEWPQQRDTRRDESAIWHFICPMNGGL